MSKALSVGAVFLFLVLVVIGLCDLFRGLNASAALIALILVVSGVFNTWGALSEGSRRR